MRCRGITRGGTRCERSADGPNGLCWLHDPTRSEDRRRAARAGGKSKPSREVQALKADVRDVIAKVERGELERNDATVILQGYRVLKDLVELERRAKVTDELAAELAELRETVERGQRPA